MIRQPVIFIDHLRLEKGNNHQPAAENQQSRLEKEEKELRGGPAVEWENNRSQWGTGAQWGAGALGGAFTEHQCPKQSCDDEHPGDLPLNDHSDRAGDRKKEPSPHVSAQRLPAEVPAGTNDESNDSRSDAIEERAQLPRRGEALIEGGNGEHQKKRSQRERDGHGEPAGDAAADVSAVDGELIGQRTGAGGGQGQPIFVFLCREPRALLDEIAAHGIRQRDRSSEAKRAEAKKIGGQARDRWHRP